MPYYEMTLSLKQIGEQVFGSLLNLRTTSLVLTYRNLIRNYCEKGSNGTFISCNTVD